MGRNAGGTDAADLSRVAPARGGRLGDRNAIRIASRNARCLDDTHESRGDRPHVAMGEAPGAENLGIPSGFRLNRSQHLNSVMLVGIDR